MVAPLLNWGNPVEVERRRRIRLSVWAYAYEVASTPLVSDARFDAEAAQSDPTIETGHLDDWWRVCFTPHTGMWILSHPELSAVAQKFQTLRSG